MGKLIVLSFGFVTIATSPIATIGKNQINIQTKRPIPVPAASASLMWPLVFIATFIIPPQVPRKHRMLQESIPVFAALFMFKTPSRHTRTSAAAGDEYKQHLLASPLLG